jgi:HSP20 family protein
MQTISRWDPLRGLNSLQDQVNRLFDESFSRGRSGESEMGTWAPAVDIYETEQELVLKADLPEVNEHDIDIRVENNVLTIRGERKFQNEVSQDNFLRIERACGPFTRSFSLPNSIHTEAIKADYRNGVLSVRMPKREESKPKQIRIGVGSNGRA